MVGSNSTSVTQKNNSSNSEEMYKKKYLYDLASSFHFFFVKNPVILRNTHDQYRAFLYNINYEETFIGQFLNSRIQLKDRSKGSRQCYQRQSRQQLPINFCQTPPHTQNLIYILLCNVVFVLIKLTGVRVLTLTPDTGARLHATTVHNTIELFSSQTPPNNIGKQSD